MAIYASRFQRQWGQWSQTKCNNKKEFKQSNIPYYTERKDKFNYICSEALAKDNFDRIINR